MKKVKPALIFLLKLLTSAGLLVFFFTRIDFHRFLLSLAAADFQYVALALVVYLTAQLVSAVRWTVLARPLGFKAPFKDFVVYYLIGMFFNLFAPSTVGGDVSRVYYLAREGQGPREKSWGDSTLHAAVSVLADRAVGMMVLIWLGALGLVFFPGYALPPALRSLIFSLALGFVFAGVLLPLLRRILPHDGHPLVVKLRLALRCYRADWRVVPQTILLSFVIHLIQAWMHLVMGRALQMEIPFSYCIILYPLVGAFAALPVSLNGLGLREGGYLFLLGALGVGSEKGIAFGLLLLLVVVVDSLIGGLVFLLKKGPHRAVLASEMEVKSGSE